MSPLPLEVKPRSDMEIVRKLEDICQNLILPEEQGEIVEFLTKTENAQKVNGLVEDVHEVLMGYQVCILNDPFFSMSDLHSDFTTTGYPQ